MTPEIVVTTMQRAMEVMVLLGGPLLLSTLVIGLVVSIFQAATQINDTAVGFLPRVVAGMIVVWALGGWMMQRLSGFLAQAIALMAGR